MHSQRTGCAGLQQRGAAGATGYADRRSQVPAASQPPKRSARTDRAGEARQRETARDAKRARLRHRAHHLGVAPADGGHLTDPRTVTSLFSRETSNRPLALIQLGVLVLGGRVRVVPNKGLLRAPIVLLGLLCQPLVHMSSRATLSSSEGRAWSCCCCWSTQS
jgi:hypothetical protein